MAAVYSVPLFDERGVTAATVPVLCPSGKVMVLRDVDIYVSSVIPGNFFLRSAVSGGTIWAFGFESLLGVYQGWRGRQVFTEGTGFLFESDDAADVRASGYLLDA